MSTDAFTKTFSYIFDSLPAMMRSKNPEEIDNTLKWLKTVVSYNVPTGKQIRGRLVEFAYGQLVPNATHEAMERARILGWCVEMLQTAYLIADDIMDNGIMRRGKPCWYRVHQLGTAALNDAFLLEHLALQLIRTVFGKSDKYLAILNLMLRVTFKTTLGQSVDTRFSKDSQFDKYNESLYNFISTYKTGYYTVYLPIALAMALAGVDVESEQGKKLQKSIKKITLQIGTLFQVQDDYLDCFMEADKLGKIGTDIQEGKCTWLFVTAIKLGSRADIRILKSNYGKQCSENALAVREVYKRLDLPSVFREFENNMHHDITKNIEKIDHSELQNILATTLSTVYGRNN